MASQSAIVAPPVDAEPRTTEAEADQLIGEGPKQAPASDAVAEAKAEKLASEEGLTLIRSSGATGFRWVKPDWRCTLTPYRARREGSHAEYRFDLGSYAFAAEAALAIARHLGPDGCQQASKDTRAPRRARPDRAFGERPMRSSLPPSATVDEPLYQVERILQERSRGDGKEYRIKWVGFPMSMATWEPETNILDPALISWWENGGVWQSHSEPQAVTATTSNSPRDRPAVIRPKLAPSDAVAEAEAERLASEEGLTLNRSSSKTGFRWVGFTVVVTGENDRSVQTLRRRVREETSERSRLLLRLRWPLHATWALMATSKRGPRGRLLAIGAPRNKP